MQNIYINNFNYSTKINSPDEVDGSVKPYVEDNTYVDFVDFNRDNVSGWSVVVWTVSIPFEETNVVVIDGVVNVVQMEDINITV